MSCMSHLLIVFVIQLVTCVIRRDRFVNEEAGCKDLDFARWSLIGD